MKHENRTFLDENNNIVTFAQLQSEYNELVSNGEIEKDITVYQFINDCTAKNGALTEIF